MNRQRMMAVRPKLFLDSGALIAAVLSEREDSAGRNLLRLGEAGIVECDAALFVTQDTLHFLQNPLIGPPETRLRVKTSYEALKWCRDQVTETDDADEA